MRRNVKLKQYLIYFISAILIFYGVVGSLLSIYFLNELRVYQPPFQSQSKELMGSIESEFEAMSKTMGKASQSATNAANSINSAKDSLNNAQNSAEISSQIVGDIAPLMTRVGDAFNVCFLGICPFQSKAEWFYRKDNELKNLSHNLNELSTSIGKTAKNLEVNSKDMIELSKNFDKMSEQLSEVSKKFKDVFNIEWMTEKFKKIGNIFLIWFLSLHVILILIGIGLMYYNDAFIK